MLAVLKPQAALADELEEELVDDAGGLQDTLRALAAKERTGDGAELRVDQLEKVVDRRGVACAPFVQ